MDYEDDRWDRADDRWDRRARRRDDGDDDVISELLPWALGIILVIGAVGAALGWLDSQLGWGLLPWAKGLLGIE